jgi:ribosome biogenesis GTPase / thiamine phosphate phosphatase
MATVDPMVAAGVVRVVRADKGSVLVAPADDGPVRAELDRDGLAPLDGDRVVPTVGDWVRVDDVDGAPHVREVLPRTSALVRDSAGATSREQVLAANVDIVLVVEHLDPDPDLGRVERLLTLVWRSGALPVVVLTKADLVPDPAAMAQDVARAALAVDVHAVSAATGQGLEPVRELLTAGTTLAVVGPSGAGKSTLVNALAGEERQRTAAVRDDDSRGRHTTTHRELVRLPGGALLIDTPGIRSLGVAGAADGIDTAFADIADLALTCRFSDCRHAGEPGCAIAAALSDGTLSADRLASHRKLEREAAYVARANDPLLQAEERRKWKAIHVAVNQQMRRKYGDDR